MLTRMGAAAGSMRRNGVLTIHHGIEAAGALGPKTQSPATFQWRLHVEVRHICHSGTTIKSDTSLVLNGQSPLPDNRAATTISLLLRSRT
jgi:hypothetical protein